MRRHSSRGVKTSSRSKPLKEEDTSRVVPAKSRELSLDWLISEASKSPMSLPALRSILVKILEGYERGELNVYGAANFLSELDNQIVDEPKGLPEEYEDLMSVIADIDELLDKPEDLVDLLRKVITKLSPPKKAVPPVSS